MKNIKYFIVILIFIIASICVSALMTYSAYNWLLISTINEYLNCSLPKVDYKFFIIMTIVVRAFAKFKSDKTYALDDSRLYADLATKMATKLVWVFVFYIISIVM